MLTLQTWRYNVPHLSLCRLCSLCELGWRVNKWILRRVNFIVKNNYILLLKSEDVDINKLFIRYKSEVFLFFFLMLLFFYFSPWNFSYGNSRRFLAGSIKAAYYLSRKNLYFLPQELSTALSLIHHYVPVKSKLQHPPRAFEFLENFCSNSSLTGTKSRSNAPPPGKISRLLFNFSVASIKLR